MENCELTILTPTYNRKECLLRLYKSLCMQTISNFQWLIIDDGSTDGTKEIITEFKNHSFDIDYYWKENGGKHTALNYSHKFIKGKYVCIVDSDDLLIQSAVESISEKIKQYQSRENIKVIVFLRGKSTTNALCESFPKEDVISNSIDFIVNEHRTGDCCEVISTDAFREFPFPEYKNEKFMGEGYLWNNVAFKYDAVYVNKIIYICEYLEGGLTKSGRALRIRCPLGGMDNSNSYLQSSSIRIVNKKSLLKETMLFICYGKFAGMKRNEIIRKCNNSRLAKLYYILGVLLYLYWKKKYV